MIDSPRPSHGQRPLQSPSAPTYRLLGPLVVAGSGTDEPIGGPLARGLLAMLLLDVGRIVSTARLVDGLWTIPPSTVRNTLQKMVSRLRTVVDAPLDHVGGGYRLQVAREDLDIAVLGDALGAAAMAEGAEITARLQSALGLVRGRPLEDLGGLPFVVGATADLREVIRRAQQVTANRLLGEGRPDLAAELLVGVDPTDEGLAELRAHALALQGRPGDALDVIRRTRRALGTELGLDLSASMTDLELRLLRREVAGPPPVGSGSTGPRTADPRSALIGRNTDLAAVAALLAQPGVVCLTGPPGVGKSALARALTGPAGPHPGISVAVVAGTPDLLSDVAAAVGAPRRPGGDLAGAVAGTLVSLGTTLVLERCEVDRTAVREMCRALVDAGVGVTVLATSRQRIGVPGERLHVLAPLAVDGANPPALQLLLRRTTDSDPDQQHGPADRVLLQQIAERLDGLPLALELAAGLLRILTPEQVLQRLDDRFALLRDGSSEPLRAALDDSVALLGADAALLYARLGTFPAAAAIPSVEAVCGRPPLQPTAVPGLLAELLDASLIERRRTGSGVRIHLLDTMRADAATRLEVHDPAPGAFLDEVHGLIADAEDRYRGADEAAWLDRLDARINDVRAALDRTIAAGAAPRAQEACRRLRGFWFWRNHIAEGLDWCQRALALQGGTPTTVAGARGVQGLLRFLSGDLAGARADLAAAVPALEAGGEAVRAAECAVHLGAIDTLMGDPAGEARLRSTLDVLTAAQRPDLAAELHATRAMIARLRGDGQGAVALAQQALADALAARHAWAEGWARQLLGQLGVDRGDLGLAVRELCGALSLNLARGDVAGQLVNLHHLAGALGRAGDWPLAAELIGAARARAADLGYELEATDPDCGRTVEAGRAALDGAWESGLTAGAAMRTEDAVRTALDAAVELA